MFPIIAILHDPTSYRPFRRWFVDIYWMKLKQSCPNFRVRLISFLGMLTAVQYDISTWRKGETEPVLSLKVINLTTIAIRGVNTICSCDPVNGVSAKFCCSSKNYKPISALDWLLYYHPHTFPPDLSSRKWWIFAITQSISPVEYYRDVQLDPPWP